MGAPAQLPLLTGQANQLQVRGLLVSSRYEYTVDRLNKQIFDLQMELSKVREDLNRFKQQAAQDARDAIAAEVVLFLSGILIGAMVTIWWLK